MGDTLRVVPAYFGALGHLLPPLQRRLAAEFGVTVDVRPPSFDPEISYDASRGQYNSRLLLARLTAEEGDTAKVLGVTSVDLFIPVLTYVFGEAQLGGRAAIVSTHRLAPEVYGLPADPAKLYARLEKEAVHELGHTFGLVHCTDARCVMRSSAYPEELDLKSARFCPSCHVRLRATA